MTNSLLTSSSESVGAEEAILGLGIASQQCTSSQVRRFLPSLKDHVAELVNDANESPTRIRTAAQRLLDAVDLPPLVPLFGTLWETPGIAILAGDTGVGKSVLAVHIAHLIASQSTDLLGLACKTAEKVLYYDFELTDRQFCKRFEGFSFPDNFIIGDTNPTSEDVCAFTFEHIAADLDATGAQIVVLDNITALALKTTADADVSMGIMRGLKRLQNERGVSSLVLAHTPKIPVGVPLTLNQLAGSKHLSNFADSVFFISKSVQGPRTRYIKQVKNRTDEEMPGVLVCEMDMSAGYLGFTLIGPGEETAHLAAPQEERMKPTRKAPISEILAELPVLLAKPQPAGQLEKRLATSFSTDERTIRTRLTEITTPGAAYVDDPSRGVCAVVKDQVGREVFYSLRPMQSTS